MKNDRDDLDEIEQMMTASNNQTKVCHMTSAHSSTDTRIFYKECASLALAGYDVYLVASGKSRKEKDVHIVGVGQKPSSRLQRMFSVSKKVYKQALELNCDIYHIHDPELIPYGVKLAKKGKKVIYDSHEDYPSTMLTKGYVPPFLRRVVSWILEKYEYSSCKKFAGVLCCYHWTYDRLKSACPNIGLLFNYPILKEDAQNEAKTIPSNSESPFVICYAGGISKQWNINVALKALEHLDNVVFSLAGAASEETLLTLQQEKGWEKTDYHGTLPFDEIEKKIFSSSNVGIALLDYIPQCKGTVGNLSNTKFFEYLQSGLPIICTDFSLWKEIIDRYNCGIYVNPHDDRAVADAIRFLMSNSDTYQQMSKNAISMISSTYNWSRQVDVMLDIYRNAKQQAHC